MRRGLFPTMVIASVLVALTLALQSGDAPHSAAAPAYSQPWGSQGGQDPAPGWRLDR